jgi:hypothetical protein
MRKAFGRSFVPQLTTSGNGENPYLLSPCGGPGHAGTVNSMASPLPSQATALPHRAAARSQGLQLSRAFCFNPPAPSWSSGVMR